MWFLALFHRGIIKLTPFKHVNRLNLRTTSTQRPSSLFGMFIFYGKINGNKAFTVFYNWNIKLRAAMLVSIYKLISLSVKFMLSFPPFCCCFPSASTLTLLMWCNQFLLMPQPAAFCAGFHNSACTSKVIKKRQNAWNFKRRNSSTQLSQLWGKLCFFCQNFRFFIWSQTIYIA